MDELEKIKKEIAALREWAYLPTEKTEIVASIEQAKEYLLKDQPDTELTPEGFYYRGADRKVKKVPVDCFWVKSERRIVPMAEYRNRNRTVSWPPDIQIR
jgi:hypothetical protein